MVAASVEHEFELLVAECSRSALVLGEGEPVFTLTLAFAEQNGCHVAAVEDRCPSRSGRFDQYERRIIVPMSLPKVTSV
jgi:hypothetical protein